MLPSPVVAKAGLAYNAASGGSYSGSALANVINFHGGPRTLYWRFDLLHNDRTYKGDITPYVAKATIQHDTTRAVKRSLDLEMVETVASQSVTVQGGVITSAGIDYINDLVQPFALIAVPGTSDWLHCPLGVFRFTRPGVSATGYAIVRHATMPDFSSVVQQNQATDNTSGGVGIPLTLPPGQYVIDVITSLLVNPTTNVPSNPATLSNLPGCALGTLLPSNVTGSPAGNSPGDWPTSTQLDAKIPSGGYIVNEGESYLDLINHLLATVGCYELMSDHNGVFRIQQWPPSQNYTLLTSKDGYSLTGGAAQFTYSSTTDSIISFGMTEDFLLDDIVNVVEVIVEDGYRTSFKATATNDDAASPYNRTALGQRVKTVRDPMVPDVGASGANYAQNYAKQQLLMASWLTDEVSLPTAVNPLHAGGLDHDIVALNIYQQYVAAGSAQNNPIIIDSSLPGIVSTEKFVQLGWTMTATLATPGSGSGLVGNAGLTTVLESREQKQGHVMMQRLQRITSTLNAANITVS